MLFRMNRKAVFYMTSGFIVSLLSLYWIWSYNALGGLSFLYGSALYPLGIVLLSRAPDDGLFGRWVIPSYAFAWSFLNWMALHEAWVRIGPPESNGWGAVGAATSVLIAQAIAHILACLPRVQRVLKFRVGIAMALIYPVGLVYMFTHRM